MGQWGGAGGACCENHFGLGAVISVVRDTAIFFSEPELFFDTILLVLGYLGSRRDSRVVRVVENRARVRAQDIASVIYVCLCTM